jgi:FMN phosphatase YigB (HAD superfamily)
VPANVERTDRSSGVTDSQRRLLSRPHTVTFACWSTLIQEGRRRPAVPTRAQIAARRVGVTEEHAAVALRAAWRSHQVAWHRRQIFSAEDIAHETLHRLGASLSQEALRELVDAFESHALHYDLYVADGAVAALERLAEAGVRRALVCDTGCTPGRIVRALLDRVGLLQWFEVLVFSDEIGFHKPHSRPFRSALDRLGVSPEGAVHVGDLRRSDIAGAHGCGMGAVRLTVFHDDGDALPSGNAYLIDCADAGCDPACERPEADAVVGSFASLIAQLEY